MIFLIKPILFKFMQSESVKRLIVDLMRAYVKTTENTVDDSVADFVERNLFPTRRVEK
jgi:hypothetical protein|tara:strand:+ start:3971 stop:4144 length:174 start_codon:yes stop_codon:yes gene_type:complete